MNWQEAEELYPACGAYWDIYWSNANEPAPEDIFLEAWKPRRDATDLWIFSFAILPADQIYPNPYTNRNPHWPSPYGHPIWRRNAWIFQPQLLTANADPEIQRTDTQTGWEAFPRPHKLLSRPWPRCLG